MAVNHLTVR